MKPKKDQSPLALKVIRWIFPKVEKLAPRLAHRWFIRLFFTPLNFPVPPKEKEIEKEAALFTLGVHGKKVQCYQWGKSPFVLVVHGWAGRATQFRKFVSPLNQQGYAVIGFDAVAHGKSEGKMVSVLDFEETLRQLIVKCGNPVAVIAHSFGGVACLYAAMNGVRIEKLINISSPTIAADIINSYLKGLHASPASGQALERYIIAAFGKPFEEFSALYTIQHQPRPVNLLLVHDDNDAEVSVEHPLALVKLYASATLFRTQGLGHTRILKDETVIQRCLGFILAPKP